MLSTIWLMWAIAGSGSGFRASRKAHAACVLSSSVDAVHRMPSISLPKIWLAGMALLASVEAARFRKGRNPPGVNFTPKANDLPSSVRVYLPL